MRIHSLIHEPFEDTGYIRVWAEKKGHSFLETRLYLGEALPQHGDYDLLVVMGGSMNIYEEGEFPWLAEEKGFIGSAIDAGKKMVGICLGSQLIASVLGARVRKNRCPEIGWFEVEKTVDAGKAEICRNLPESFFVFHWHGDTFDIPEGSIHLFRSAACENQGFLYDGRVLGLQFHPETMRENLERLVDNCPDEIKTPSEYVQALPQIFDESHIGRANEIMTDFLEYFEI